MVQVGCIDPVWDYDWHRIQAVCQLAINFRPAGTGTLSQNGDNNHFAQQL